MLQFSFTADNLNVLYHLVENFKMTSFMSQMLDELMGKNRDLAPSDKPPDIHWDDSEVAWTK